MNAFDEISAELFARGHRVRFRAAGSSMFPTIRNGETITVEPAPAATLAVGDIAFYRTERGVTAHRVVATGGVGKTLLARGDAPGSETEAVEPDWILGKVVAIERGGRSIDPAGRTTKMTNFMLQCASRARRRAVVMTSYLLASLALFVVLCAPAQGAVGYVADAAQSVGFDPTAGQTSYSWTTVTLHPGDCTTNSVENMAVVVSSSHHAMVSGVTFAGRTLANMNIPADTTGVGDAYVGVFYGALQATDCPTTGTLTQTVTFTLAPGTNPLLCGAASVLRDARPRGSGDKLGLLLKRDPGSYLPHELVQHLPKNRVRGRAGHDGDGIRRPCGRQRPKHGERRNRSDTDLDRMRSRKW